MIYCPRWHARTAGSVGFSPNRNTHCVPSSGSRHGAAAWTVSGRWTQITSDWSWQMTFPTAARLLDFPVIQGNPGHRYTSVSALLSVLPAPAPHRASHPVAGVCTCGFSIWRSDLKPLIAVLGILAYSKVLCQVATILAMSCRNWGGAGKALVQWQCAWTYLYKKQWLVLDLQRKFCSIRHFSLTPFLHRTWLIAFLGI